MKYCAKCGTALPDTARFCRNCGWAFESLNEMQDEKQKERAAVPAEPDNPGMTPVLETISTDSAQKMKLLTVLAAALATCILLILLPWVQFHGTTLMAGSISSKYSAVSIPEFSDDHFQFLYWRMYDYWGHHGASRFRAAANGVRLTAVLTLFVQAASAACLLIRGLRNQMKLLLCAASAACSTYLSIRFIVWMAWFQRMLVKYDGSKYSHFVRVNAFPYLTALLSGTILLLCVTAVVKEKRAIENP